MRVLQKMPLEAYALFCEINPKWNMVVALVHILSL